jgi:hypothetical protein
MSSGYEAEDTWPLGTSHVTHNSHSADNPVKTKGPLPVQLVKVGKGQQESKTVSDGSSSSTKTSTTSSTQGSRKVQSSGSKSSSSQLKVVESSRTNKGGTKLAQGGHAVKVSNAKQKTSGSRAESASSGFVLQKSGGQISPSSGQELGGGQGEYGAGHEYDEVVIEVTEKEELERQMLKKKGQKVAKAQGQGEEQQKVVTTEEYDYTLSAGQLILPEGFEEIHQDYLLEEKSGIATSFGSDTPTSETGTSTAVPATPIVTTTTTTTATKSVDEGKTEKIKGTDQQAPAVVTGQESQPTVAASLKDIHKFLIFWDADKDQTQ